MSRGFWDKQSKKLSRILWKPSLKESNKTDSNFSNWNCYNKNISFSAVSNKSSKQSNIESVFSFKKMPIINKDHEKIRLFNKLFSCELGRFSKIISNKKINYGFIKTYINQINKLSDQNISLNYKYISITHIINVFQKKNSIAKNITDEHNKFINAHINVIDKIHLKMAKIDGIVRCKKISLHLLDKQKKIINNWFDDSIELYNILVDEFKYFYDKKYKKYEKIYTNNKLFINNLIKSLKKNKRFPLNGRKLRDILAPIYKNNFTLPYCILSDLIMNFVSNINGNLTKLKKGQIENFTINKKKISRKYLTLPIQTHYTTEKGFYPSLMGKIFINDNVNWLDIEKDFLLVYDKNKKKYYVHCPMYRETKKVENRKPLCVSDPGERTFQKIYGLDHIISVGDNLREPIIKQLNKIEVMNKRLNDKEFNDEETKKMMDKKKIKIKEKNDMKKQILRYNPNNKELREKYFGQSINKPKYDTQKKNFKKVINRTYKKIENMVTEMHNKLSIYLCKKYDRIMVTDFSCKKVNSKKGDLGPQTKRVLGMLSHYRFRLRLQNKCEEYRCQYIEVNESYTSKTCCNCGNIKDDLGSSKIYECKKCKNIIDRDVNGAINILIKNQKEVLE